MAVELWVRRWLYAKASDARITAEFDGALDRFQSAYNPAAAAEFRDEFENLLLPLRDCDVAVLETEPQGLNPDQTRLWGKVTDRILAFLRADGVFAIVPEQTVKEAIAIPFRFFVTSGAAVCRDADHRDLEEWSRVLRELQRLRIVPEGLSVQVEVSFHDKKPRGDSLGLALALAYERWRADPGTPFYAPLEVLATGRIAGGRVGQVVGTGGQTKHDPEGGVKGQLAERLAAKLFAAIDLSPDAKLTDTAIVSKTSGTAWVDMKHALLAVIRNLGLAECGAYLEELEDSDAAINGSDLSKQDLCWGKIGRLQRLIAYSQPEAKQRLLAQRDRLASDLGFTKHFLRPFADIEIRHSHVFGRDDDLDRLTRWIEGTMQWITIIAAPIGHGKSALMTGLKSRIDETATRSVFIHYFAQNSSTKTNMAPESLYRRLTEHLYWEIKEIPPKFDPLAAKDHLGVAWTIWRNRKERRSLVIFIDGLDEVAGTLEPIFPLDLSPSERVRLIVSCRTGNTPRPVIREWKEAAGDAHCVEYALGALTASGLEKWIENSVPSLTTIECQTLATTLFVFTKGAALFTRYLLDDIRAELLVGRPWQALLAITPKSFSEYVQKQWGILDQLALEKPHVELGMRVINQLREANGPLSRKELSEMLKTTAGLESLPPEVLRWLDVRNDTDAEKHCFALNHEAIRLALKPNKNDASRALLLDYCKNGWLRKEPHALRYFPDYLIRECAWAELEMLFANPDFTKLQTEVFPEEPALALTSIRLALEDATHDMRPDPIAVTELSLTQATLVRLLTNEQSIDAEITEIDDVLVYAEKMAGLPVQWDPTATRMWRLVAAWLYHQKHNQVKRNEYMGAFSRAPQKISYQWTYIVADLLPRCFDLPNGSGTFAEIAWRSLPADTFPILVTGVAEFSGREQAFTKWLIESTDSDGQSLLAEEQWHGLRCRCELISGWANYGNWQAAMEYAIAPFYYRVPNFRHGADRIRHLGGLARAANRVDILKELTRELVENEPRAGERPYKFWETIGQLCAWRVGCAIKCGHASREEIAYIEDIANSWLLSLARQNQPGAVTIAYELAEAFSEPTGRKLEWSRAFFKKKAAEHWDHACARWEMFKSRPNAHTLEIFQQVMWLAQTVMTMTKRNVWSPEENATKRHQWVDAIRDVLLLEDDSSRLSNMLARPESKDRARQPRMLEVPEWGQAIVTATEVLPYLSEVTPHEIAKTICLARNATDRGRGIYRCLSIWANEYSQEKANGLVNDLLETRCWKPEDVATGWALWFRHARQRNRSDALTFLVKSIMVGTARLGGPKSVHRAELAAEIAARHSDIGRSDRLFDFACDLVSDKCGVDPTAYSILLWSDLAKAATPNPKWRARITNHISVQADAADSRNVPIGAKIQIFINYACLAADFGDSDRSGKALIAAEQLTRNRIYGLCRKVNALCDVAEASARCGFPEEAERIFTEAKKLIPNSDGERPLGVKPKMLRPHLAAGWLLSVAKALTYQSPPKHWFPFVVWSETLMDPVRCWKDWKKSPEWEEGLEDLLTREDKGDFFRATAIANAWRALFDQKFHSDKRYLWNTVRDSLQKIGDPSTWARAQRDIAIMEAKADLVDAGRAKYALRRTQMLGSSIDKDDVIHRVGSAFSENYAKDKRTADSERHRIAFLLTVPDSAESFSSTYLMLANLVRLFPEHTKQVESVLRRRGLVA
ncbi:MAG TPA: hypothetical protein VNW30_05295 [Opitutaceae bacterium]|nr:hypothetical protein [Opitutaceae bacterium]